MARATKKKTIGRSDKVDFPDLEVQNLDAKVDTGAYTSALHVSKVKTLKVEGVTHVKFKLKHPNFPEGKNKSYTFPVHARRRIKNSFGQTEKRFIIRTRIKVLGKIYTTEFSLSDRSKMSSPVLLGRKFLYRRFIVDVSEKDLSYDQKMKKEAKEAKA